MRDFNFFNELMPKKKKKTSSSAYMVLLTILLVGALGAATYYFYTELNDTRNEVNALESQLNDPTFIAEYDEALELQEELQQIERERDQIQVYHVRLDNSRIIDNLLINEISLAKPNTIAISSITFNEQNVNLEGTATDKDSLARFEHNLRGNDRFVGPFIPNIQRIEEDEYSFSLSFNVEVQEEGNANGED